MQDAAPLSPEEKLDYVFTWVQRQERAARRRRILQIIKWSAIILAAAALIAGSWYAVTHVDDFIRFLADRIAGSVSERVQESSFLERFNDLLNR